MEFVDWPDRPDVYMPYTPAIKVTGGKLVFFAGVTAAPVYHSHPHIPAEFDNIPLDMPTQARMALENLKRSVEAAGGTMESIVSVRQFLTDVELQSGLMNAWKDFRPGSKPCTTTVQVVRLATDPRCLVELDAIAVVDD
jgi:enamine deaminase RidA (YjgF/YER057c/UK114 family)